MCHGASFMEWGCVVSWGNIYGVGVWCYVSCLWGGGGLHVCVMKEEVHVHVPWSTILGWGGGGEEKEREGIYHSAHSTICRYMYMYM